MRLRVARRWRLGSRVVQCAHEYPGRQARGRPEIPGLWHPWFRRDCSELRGPAPGVSRARLAGAGVMRPLPGAVARRAHLHARPGRGAQLPPCCSMSTVRVLCTVVVATTIPRPLVDYDIWSGWRRRSARLAGRAARRALTWSRIPSRRQITSGCPDPGVERRAVSLRRDDDRYLRHRPAVRGETRRHRAVTVRK